MTAKKIATLLVLAATVLAVVLVPSIALANMGPHGGYISNTEACAGCHRAHTAPSSVTWVGNDTAKSVKSALLLSDATTVYQFCLACHDSTSQGADTNVLDGVYEGTQYGTQGKTLLGGAFGREDPNLPKGALYDSMNNKVTSTHVMNGQSWGAWGGGTFGSTATDTAHASGNVVGLLGTGDKIVMDCGTCHDPHGSSNYRILKDVVYGVPVGGYDPAAPASATTPTPTPFVISKEKGFPQGGFALHTQYTAYQPNYTKAMYAIAPGGNELKGMSGWCTGCHTTYMTKTSQYDAGDGFGFVSADASHTPVIRHRHPINVPLTNFVGVRALVVTDSILPLAHGDGASAGVGTGVVANTDADWIECLTCHNAHGASTVMTGWANVADPANDLRVNTGLGGVPPTNDSALLKLDNRGVCETCHNK
jgi:hypothetical protein